jgi:hypothetical protein
MTENIVSKARLAALPRAMRASQGRLAAIAWARRNDQIVASVRKSLCGDQTATVTRLTLWNLRAQARHLPGDTRPYELLTGCWDGIDSSATVDL